MLIFINLNKNSGGNPRLRKGSKEVLGNRGGHGGLPGKLATMYSFTFLTFKVKDSNLLTKRNALNLMVLKGNVDLKWRMS